MSNLKLISIYLITFILVITYTADLSAGSISFRLFSSGINVNRTIESAAELKFENIVKQKYDVSCGSAALATIFNYSYNDKIKEEEIIEKIVNFKNISSLKKSDGFTLLDLKIAAEFFNYNAYGLKGEIEAVKSLNLPTIVLLNSPKGPHFVVVNEIYDDRVQIADPALGNMFLDINTFKKQWNNVLLAIESKNRPLSQSVSKYDSVKLETKYIFRTINPNWREFPLDYRDF